MTQAERGVLLLTCHLGNPERKCLTVPQFRQLAQRVRSSRQELEDRELMPEDLAKLGYGREQAERIVGLLEQELALDSYLRQCRKAGCGVVSRISEGYPQELRRALGLDAPGVLWYKGDLSILDGPKIALVGSRNISPENEKFAREVGIQAAKQGFTLVSGNARGADRIAQDACLEAGGKVISVVADDLREQKNTKNLLFLSEDGFDCHFSPQRALSRNRIIHALPGLTLVAQCTAKTGGTWDGTVKNLQAGWSKVCCFNDGSIDAQLLAQMGAELVSISQLPDLDTLSLKEANLFDLL